MITKIKALYFAKKVDIESMNDHYEGFGEIYKNNFIKGLELWIDKYNSKVPQK